MFCFVRWVGPAASRSSGTRVSTTRWTAGRRPDGSWRKSSTTSASCSHAPPFRGDAPADLGAARADRVMGDH